MTTNGDVTTMSDPGSSQVSSANMLGVGGETASPARNRSMKDYATQISELKKENFSLKLRIFYMEERMQERFTGDYEQVFKSNIELKVECDSLRKELHDKHDLLIKASNAVACMEAAPNEAQKAREEAQGELQQVRDAMREKVQEADRELRDVRAEADDLARNVHELQNYIKKLEDENQELKKDCEDANDELATLKEAQEEEENEDSTRDDREPAVTQQQILEKEKLIEQLRETLDVKQTMMEALEDEKKLEIEQIEAYQETIKNLEEKNKKSESELIKSKQQDERMRAEYMIYIELEHEYQQHISEQQQRLDEFEIAARQMSEELEKREEEVQDLTEALKDAEETGKELADNLEKLQKEKETQKSKELLMRDKAITGLTEVIRKKEEEITNLKTDITHRESRLGELTETISSLSLQSAQDDKAQELRELEKELQQMKRRNMDLEAQNQKLSSELENGEELVRSLDETIKEKDEELQNLLSKYKKLLRKQQDDEVAAAKALKQQQEMADRFEQEKKEFADLLKKTKAQFEESQKDAERPGTEEVRKLQEQMQILESHLRSKQLQLEEATNLFKKAENDRKTALDELEAAMKRRDEEQKREVESRNRINAAKTAEIERLREEIRMKEDGVQNLEDDLMHLDRTAHEARDKAILSAREAARWKDDSGQKDNVILELTKSLEELGGNSSNYDHKQLIRLTRENAELKQLLKAREAELSFLQSEPPGDDPYIQSLKNEIARKDKIIADERQLQDSLHNAFVTWSKISEDTSSMNLVLETLRLDIENYKKELNNAKNVINQLSLDLEASQQQTIALHKACEVKDRIIEDLKASQKLYPTVETEEESGETIENLEKKSETSPKRKQRYKKRRPRREDASFLSTSTNTPLKFNTDDEEHFSLVSSENEDFLKNIHHTHGSKEQLEEEIQKLQQDLHELKDEHHDKVTLYESLRKIEKQRKHLKRLAEILEEEQNIYRSKNASAGQDPRTSQSDYDGPGDPTRVKRSLDIKLMEVEQLRKNLQALLLEVSSVRDMPTQENDPVQSVESTILPLNQTSYMEMPVMSNGYEEAESMAAQLSELQTELEKTRNQLADTVRELADLKGKSSVAEQLKNQLLQRREENSELQKQLEEALCQGEMKDIEMTALRVEVDKLRIRSKRSRGSDTDNTLSICSGDESDGMSALSRRELVEVVNNARKKLQNAEKLNELLRHQLESSSKEAANNPNTMDQNLTEQLSAEVERLREQLKNTQDQLKRKSDQPGTSILKSPPTASPTSVRSKLPIPVEKHHKKDSASGEQKEIADLRTQCRQLRAKLSATEETVRQQTVKLKKCKSAMAAAGIGDLMLSPVRSARSHPNLVFSDAYAERTPGRETLDLSSRQRHESTETVEANTQTTADDTGYFSSLSPQSEQRFNSLIQSQAKELSVLRQQLKKSRETCKDLKTELDIVLRYVSALLNSDTAPADTMLANSITTELDRCKELTRKLKRQLSEWSSDSSISDTDSEGSPKRGGGSLVHRQTSQIIKKNQELQEKNDKIFELERRLQDLMLQKHDMDTQNSFNKAKHRKFAPEAVGLLTPSSSRHSIVSNTDDELATTVLRATVSQNTEYVPLPNRRSPHPHPDQNSSMQSPRARKSLPMYQRTIAVTEYLPGAMDHFDDIGSLPGRRRLPTGSDAENCTATYGGSWSPSSKWRPNSNQRSTPTNAHMDPYSEPLLDGGSCSPEVEALKRKLDDSKRFSRSLKEELDLTNEALREAKQSEGYSPVGRNPADILEEHLKEIRALRQHLEASIETNDLLREQLKRKLLEAGSDSSLDHVSANIYLPAETREECKYAEELEGLREKLSRANEANARLKHQLEAESQMKNNYAATARELEQLRMRLVESSCQTDMLGKHIDDLNLEIDNERAQNEALRSQLQERDEDLAKLQEAYEESICKNNQLTKENMDANTSAARMRDEINRISEEADESHHLVRSLKSELALYEKFHKTKGLTDPRNQESRGTSANQPGSSLDISEFLEEIKRLRVQLERSIEVNSALRKQLQEQLDFKKKRGSSATPGKTTTINIHHLPDNSPRGTSSAPNSSRRKLRMNEEHKSTGELMTPPPSASSCSEDRDMLAFEFSPLPGQSSTHYGKKGRPASQRENKGSPNWPYYSLSGPYVLGKLDDYNELKRKITDSRLFVRGVDVNVADRSANASYSSTRGSRKHRHPKGLDDLEPLAKMLEESGRLLKMFWPAAIPPPPIDLEPLGAAEAGCQRCTTRQSDASSDISKCTKDAGFASDSSINSEADGLRREVGKLHKRLSAQDKLLQSTVSRLQTANRMKEGIEHAILKQLTVTHDVLKKARGNLEAKASETKSKDHNSTFS